MVKKKKSNTSIVFILIIGLLSIAVVAVIDSFDTAGYVEADILTVEGTTIIIGNGCRAIVAETSPERAYSIELGIVGLIDERPNTHDIFAETLRSFNISLEYVTLDNFVDGVYYSKLVLKSGDKFLKLDSKPSDAIALALRTNSTIYINQSFLEEYADLVC